MNKFIVNNILIEKSERDISTGKSYDFNSGFNLVCGNNEAGKSSIMNFLKESFFLEKGTETGKIFFQVDENGKKYRADIKPSSRKSDRCVLFDDENNLVNYSFVEEYIKQNYFKAGFTINLDDLNSLQQNKVDLVNVIKDPLNDKLSASLENINSQISDVLTDKGKLKTSYSDILTKIKNINNEINELSQKEAEYNFIIEKINELNFEIDRNKNIIDYLNLSKNLNKLKEEIFIKKEDLKNQEKAFNQVFFDNKNKVIDLLQEAIKYKSNLSIKDKKEQEIQLKIEKIKEKFENLMVQCGLVLDEKIIANIVIDNSINTKINELIEINKELLFDIKVKSDNQKTYQNEIDKLENLPAENLNIEDLKKLKEKIENSLKTINYLREEIENIDRNILASNDKKYNLPLIISFVALFIVSIVVWIIGNMNKINNAYIFTLFGVVVLFSNYLIINFNKKKNSFTDEKSRKEEQKDKILQVLKEDIGKFYPNIDFNSAIQIETIKYSLTSLIERQTQLIQVENELTESNKKLAENEQEILSLKDEQIKNVSDDKYIEIMSYVASIKEEIRNRDELKNEIDFIEKENVQIIDSFKKFIIENELTIPLVSDFDENMKNLNVEQEKNNDIKNKIVYLKSDIENKEKELQQIIEKEAALLNKVDFILQDDLDEQIEQIENVKKEKEEIRQEFQIKKAQLEEFEGISDKKIEKSLKLNEYRKIVKGLIINKMALSLIDIAKGNFNQTQPDLVNAQRYLSILTNGKYSKINLELQEISNEDNSLIKKWEILSRGTKEQLYLALRLGYASNYSSKNNKPSLPLIIDDAFVNFDVLRTKSALICLSEFAKTNQVLFFTCHTEQMQKLLKELKISDVNILTV